jgi:hypothetical protein
MKRFRYALEPARLAALAEEGAAGRSHLAAREALTHGEAALAALGRWQPPLEYGPAGILAAGVAQAERARAIREAEVTEARELCREAREMLLAAVARRARLDAHRESRLAVFRRDEAAAEERRRFTDSLCAPGAFALAFETAPA